MKRPSKVLLFFTLHRLIFRGSVFLVFLIVLFVKSSAVFSAPFERADLQNGKVLHERNCSSCHNSMFPGGHGNEIYSKDTRKIDTSKKLYSMVEFCASNNNLSWFEEELLDVSGFLNKAFYKFK